MPTLKQCIEAEDITDVIKGIAGDHNHDDKYSQLDHNHDDKYSQLIYVGKTTTTKGQSQYDASGLYIQSLAIVAIYISGVRIEITYGTENGHTVKHIANFDTINDEGLDLVCEFTLI